MVERNRSTSPTTILPNASNQMKMFSRLPNIVASAHLISSLGQRSRVIATTTTTKTAAGKCDARYILGKTEYLEK